MHNELTNLIPPERQQALRRDYFIRLGVVATILLIILTLIAALLLLPTYVFLIKSARAETARLANIESALSSSNEAALSAQLAALSNNAATLLALSSAHSVSAILRAVLAISRPGISLSGFSHPPSVDGEPDTFAISGIAATRDALRNYQLALQRAPFARSADLPVSAYAKDTAIAFTITVILAP
ncbi:MAG: hypothetical protein Q8O94_01225 [bacterium]|nr:hypothetical protein [bacterium]